MRSAAHHNETQRVHTKLLERDSSTGHKRTLVQFHAHKISGLLSHAFHQFRAWWFCLKHACLGAGAQHKFHEKRLETHTKIVVSWIRFEPLPILLQASRTAFRASMFLLRLSKQAVESHTLGYISPRQLSAMVQELQD